MSETVTTAEHPVTPSPVPPEEPFDYSEIKAFQADDAEAGTNICKMLVAFFFYSAVAMGLVAWWAFGASRVNDAGTPTTPQESHVGTAHGTPAGH